MFAIDLNSLEVLPLDVTMNHHRYLITDIDAHSAVLNETVNQVFMFGGYINGSTLSDLLLTYDLDSHVLRVVGNH